MKCIGHRQLRELTGAEGEVYRQLRELTEAEGEVYRA